MLNDPDNLNFRGKKIVSANARAFMVYHPRTLTSRHGTWWLNVGNLLECSRIHQALPPSRKSVRSVSPSRAPEATSSHNSGLLHDPCRGVHEPLVSYMNAATNVSSACYAV